MIQITIEGFAGRARTAALQVEGHAGLATKGNDILCAAVSVLSENLGGGLKLLLKAPAKIQADNGLYRVEIPLEHSSDASELLFQSAILGLRVLAEQYPDRIRIHQIET
ncbi:MAG: ribosomal-processing cysteine protease Prp [bacterium]|nr:ribosomal-processing cysteine protease Prp [bacterium]